MPLIQCGLPLSGGGSMPLIACFTIIRWWLYTINTVWFTFIRWWLYAINRGCFTIINQVVACFSMRCVSLTHCDTSQWLHMIILDVWVDK